MITHPHEIQYTVILESPENDWVYFLVECANSVEHAEEQALDAYPDHAVLWVNTGENYSME